MGNDLGMRQVPALHQELQTKQIQALQARADLVCSAAPQEVQRCLQELEQRGCIAQDISVGCEETVMDDALAEKEFDADWDFSDEDSLTVESDEVLPDVSETGPFLTDDAYVLRVFRDENGGVEIDVPEMGGETYIGRDALGGMTLKKLDQRRDAYRAIAEWLLRSDAMKQAKSPDEFLSNHRPSSQTDFFATEAWANYTSLAELKKEERATLFSNCLRTARLAWSTGSISLRRLFK